jgi:dTDP-4-amino-4,6-dideoxygalactose transaminase
MSHETIYVTQPDLPPLEDFVPLLQEIWNSRFLTNGGSFHQAFEKALADYLGVEEIAVVANGTLALMIALKSLRISGEVITTPYSFVATTHALQWNDITPVFVDVDPATGNLDPSKIEAAITPSTSAILPVHCYGNPCDVDKIQAIADHYGLKVIYDGAPAFGVKLRGESVLKHGDLSILSFHATKVFTTCEGGAIVCPDAPTKQHIDNLKNFGFIDETTVIERGINGKMNEIQAALGLLQLKHFESALALRAQIDSRYRTAISSINGLSCLPTCEECTPNHSYFPILVGDDYELSRDQLHHHLLANGIRARRYFYPLIVDFPSYRSFAPMRSHNLPCATDLAQRVICLPIYPRLAQGDQDRIIALLAPAEL